MTDNFRDYLLRQWYDIRQWREIRDRADFIWLWIAWKLPRRLVMWCAIRLIASATQGEYSNQAVPELTAITALNRWK